MLTSIVIAIAVGIAVALLAGLVGWVASHDKDDGRPDPMQQAIGDSPHMDVENWK